MTAFQNIRISLLTFLFAGVLTSCAWLGDAPDDKVIDILEEFEIYAVEDITESGRMVDMVITTINPVCDQASIEVETTQGRDYIDVIIRKINQPDSCDSGQKVIMKTVTSLGELDDDRYYVNITLKNVVDNTGTLNIFSDRMVLDISNPEGIIVNPAMTYVLPENMIWGYATSYEVDYAGRIIDFVTDLSLVCENIVLPDGQYTNFTIDESDKLHFDDRPPHMNEATFYFKFSGAEQEIIDLLEDYRQEAGQRADFKIFSTNGKVY
ncbi:MAG: hypothetical protein R3275_09225 [Saprospiraceae bacterium]|nr:hypothetical protein [Saprospiraceae bacterium]